MMLVASSAMPAFGQSGTTQQSVVPPLTRAELLKKWDINGDGSLDAGEVEVASSKMRLERARLRLSTGLDPITGKPRNGSAADDADDETAADEAPQKPLTVDELAEKLGFTPVDADGDQNGKKRSSDPADNDPAGNDERRSLPPPRMFGLPPLRSQQSGALLASPGAGGLPLTGGSRAGGLPARPGYGSGVTSSSLNAGRTDASSTGGLVPRLRSATPTTNLPAGMQPPAGSLSPAPPRPRRTVDDFDVYR
jgi:hypothetical protein